MRLRKETLVALKTPFTEESGNVERRSPVLLGVMETSWKANEGSCAYCAWARMGVGLRRPTATGPMMAVAAVTASNNFFPNPILRAICCIMIASILLLRLEPVTPATQTNGDSR